MQIKFILIFIVAFISVAATSAQDSVFNRVVTVERDYQPEIQQANKIPVTPNFIKEEVEPNPVIYSTYSIPLVVDFNLHPLQAAKTDFTPQTPLNGILEGGIGHRNSHLLFGYQIASAKHTALNLYASHDAYWGRDALSQSLLGMQLVHHFRNIDMYFDVKGNNEYFTYYGKYFDGNQGLAINIGEPVEHQNLWQVSANMGLKSTHKGDVQYSFQVGYKAFIAPQYTVENQILTHFDINWTSNKKHVAGINIDVQNMLYNTLKPDSTILNRHALRIEPFYEYKHKSIRLHAGVNVDLNIGTGTLLSSVENIAFAPSPNIEFEWNMMDNIFHLYANAKGSIGIGSIEEYLGYNRYLDIGQGLVFNDFRAYTPVDAQVGFRIRPIKTMLIDIYGGYAYHIGACHMEAILQDNSPSVQEYKLWLHNEQQWKVGAQLHYHYKDIIDVNLAGNYYFYPLGRIPSMDPTSPNFLKATTTFDRPQWDAYARIDAHIDSKWSIYSENQFVGGRWAYVAKSQQRLKPIISLNIGGQYSINKWLNVYLQLNNYLNRKNDIFYGYQSQGCHFLLGVKYKF